MITEQLDLDASRRQLIDLTREVAGFCASQGDGLVNVFAPHATAGNWSSAGVPCDNVVVERVHSRRPGARS